MLRISSFLMMIVLATPMFSDCCFPIMQVSPDESEHSNHSNNEACFWNEQAIAETKGTVALRITFDHGLPFTADLISETVGWDRQSAREVMRTRPQDGIDLYLRTGVLRI